MENNVIICTGIWFLSVIYATGLSPDGQALLQFKSLLSDEFNRLSNWSSSDSTPCNWVGVSCNQDEQVVSLNLGSMNLSGSVSGPPISSLRSLSNLSLELNNFTSATLPQEIFTPSLRFLNISHCNFNESFPRNLSAATSLEVLDAYNNNFSDELPYGVGNLQRLTYLHLGGSLFTGSIPAEYGSMKSLRFLSLSGNQLTGPIPPELGDLERLEELYLGYYNVFTGGIPPELGRLQRLRLLDIASCGVNGTIPDAIGNLTSLDSLFLMINSLSGSIPDSLGRLPGLKSLDLSQNKLTGEIPQSFDKLVKLELLSLFQNQLTGTIPSFIGDLPNLQVLQMWGNTMVGPIPEQLGGSGRLQKLDLSKNLFNGSIPLNLCQGGQLDTLILQQNHLTGGIPDMLGDCPSLMRVRLADNMLAGLIPGSLFSLPNLNLLELMRNYLDGFTQEVTFTSQNLEWVDLSENKLRGELPDGIGNLLSLKLLQVSSNKISGAVPAGLGKLALLDKLNMSHNLLTGGVPEELGNCQKLTMLDLSVNQLSGEIPSELGNLLNLNILNLSRNFFSGGIPKSISGIGTLSTLDYSYNRLTGEIPHSEQAYNRTSYVGNPGLCGPPLGRCQGLPQPHRHGNGRNESLLAWLVGALFSAALLVLVFGVCCFFRKYRYYICGLLRRTSSNARSWKLTTFQRLDLNVNHILECMNEDNIIGQGGSGTVYKGVLPSGDIVAVKKLSGLGMTRKGVVSSHSDHGFSAEVQTLGKIRHRNIVRLLGFCTNKETNVLVYEYMPNGSLGEALHGKKGALLDWGTRYKIAMQAANGLAYLHHDCSPLIVHRDVKSNNILLDTEFQAHVADFGLAKLFQDSGKSESMSSIAGSYGYIAPEYAYTLKVNEKSDIYSFGVVLLELVTGRRPIEPEYGDGVDIVQWVRKKIQTKDGVLEVLDSRIGTDDNLPLQEVMLVLRVALLCTSDLPVDRPTMRDVVQMLGDAKPSKGKEGTEVSEFSTSRSQLLPPV